MNEIYKVKERKKKSISSRRVNLTIGSIAGIITDRRDRGRKKTMKVREKEIDREDKIDRKERERREIDRERLIKREKEGRKWDMFF